MKPIRRTNQPSQAIMGRPGTCLTAVVFVMASAGSVNAQEMNQMEDQLELPEEQVETIDKDRLDREKLEQEKTDNDDKAGGFKQRQGKQVARRAGRQTAGGTERQTARGTEG
ncbi:MAG: hypothetical protein U5P41_08260 [Gammaproteobacteria bacterium]|nr:hypothetical protein [Gammaproteobacteria bacterium]